MTSCADISAGLESIPIPCTSDRYVDATFGGIESKSKLLRCLWSVSLVITIAAGTIVACLQILSMSGTLLPPTICPYCKMPTVVETAGELLSSSHRQFHHNISLSSYNF